MLLIQWIVWCFGKVMCGPDSPQMSYQPPPPPTPHMFYLKWTPPSLLHIYSTGIFFPHAYVHTYIRIYNQWIFFEDILLDHLLQLRVILDTEVTWSVVSFCPRMQTLTRGFFHIHTYIQAITLFKDVPLDHLLQLRVLLDTEATYHAVCSPGYFWRVQNPSWDSKYPSLWLKIPPAPLFKWSMYVRTYVHQCAFTVE